MEKEKRKWGGSKKEKRKKSGRERKAGEVNMQAEFESRQCGSV